MKTATVASRFIIQILMKYRDLPFTKNTSSSHTVKTLFLSFTCEDAGVTMVTSMISQLQESFPVRYAAGSFQISFFTFFLFFIRILSIWNRKDKYHCLYFSIITLYPNFIIFLCHTFCNRYRTYSATSRSRL